MGGTGSHQSDLNFPSTDDRRIDNNTFRNKYRTLTDEEKARMDAVKGHGLAMHELLCDIGDSREMSIAKTKLEECVMWAVKHITR